MVQKAEPILLNGVVMYFVDCLEASVRSRLTSDMFFKSLRQSGTLRCYSGINELDGKNTRQLHTSITAA